MHITNAYVLEQSNSDSFRSNSGSLIQNYGNTSNVLWLKIIISIYLVLMMWYLGILQGSKCISLLKSHSGTMALGSLLLSLDYFFNKWAQCTSKKFHILRTSGSQLERSNNLFPGCLQGESNTINQSAKISIESLLKARAAAFTAGQISACSTYGGSSAIHTQKIQVYQLHICSTGRWAWKKTMFLDSSLQLEANTIMNQIWAPCNLGRLRCGVQTPSSRVLRSEDFGSEPYKEFRHGVLVLAHLSHKAE